MPEKILVMHEGDEARRYIGSILAGEGYWVVTAGSMADGLRHIHVEAPDLVIADSRLPVGECLHKLHDNSKFELAADVVVTAAAEDRGAAAEWLAKGAYDIVPEPVAAPRLLMAAVERALQKRRLVLENRRLTEELEQAAIQDPLTGVYNHRHMDERLLSEIVRGTRYNRPFVLMIAGIDGFRRFNETHGWHGGDRVLKGLARLLEGQMRLTDFVSRYDGGKFVLLLPETRIHQGARVAGRIVEAVRHHEFDGDRSRLRVTVSIGMAEFPSEALDGPSLVELAEQRIRGAKKDGGDGFRFEDHRDPVSEYGF
jgi:diguanylate cyclase (GGDEF)-like protein